MCSNFCMMLHPRWILPVNKKHFMNKFRPQLFIAPTYFLNLFLHPAQQTYRPVKMFFFQRHKMSWTEKLHLKITYEQHIVCYQGHRTISACGTTCKTRYTLSILGYVRELLSTSFHMKRTHKNSKVISLDRHKFSKVMTYKRLKGNGDA